MRSAHVAGELPPAARGRPRAGATARRCAARGRASPSTRILQPRWQLHAAARARRARARRRARGRLTSQHRRDVQRRRPAGRARDSRTPPGADEVEALDAVVVGVGDVHVAVAVDGDRARLGELAGRRCRAAPHFVRKRPLAFEHLDAVVFAVDHVHAAGGVDGDAGRRVKASVAGAPRAPFAEHRARRVRARRRDRCRCRPRTRRQRRRRRPRRGG